MRTTFDGQTVDVCQCTKANGTRENEGEAGTTLICPECHLEEATAREGHDAEHKAVEQAAFPDERRIYMAFKDSPSLMKIAAQNPGEQSIELVIRKRQRGQKPSARSASNLVKEYGTTTLTTSLKNLLDEGVFTSIDVAKRRFPDLFPEEQVQEPVTEVQVMHESQPGDRESEVENSRYCQNSQDPQLPISLPIRPRQRLMSQLQLILEHACFSFGQRELQKELDKWGHSCAEAVSLQTWVDLFKHEKMLETEDNAGSILNLLNRVAKVQNIVTLRLSVDFDQVNQLLSSVEEFIQLLNIPMYQSAIEQLRERVGSILRTAAQNAAAAQKEADSKFAHIEAQRKILEQQEEEVQHFLKENLGSIRDSIEHDVFTAMGQAKDALPDIGLADSR